MVPKPEQLGANAKVLCPLPQVFIGGQNNISGISMP
jgi:hypothetical protein